MDISCHQLWSVSVGQSQTISQGKCWVVFYYYFLCGREVMLAIEAQHSCPQWPLSAALCPGCCPLQKLDARVVAQPWP